MGPVDRMMRKKYALEVTENPNESLIIGFNNTSNKTNRISTRPPAIMTYSGTCVYIIYRVVQE